MEHNFFEEQAKILLNELSAKNFIMPQIANMTLDDMKKEVPLFGGHSEKVGASIFAAMLEMEN